jgi:hypothetical protein
VDEQTVEITVEFDRHRATVAVRLFEHCQIHYDDHGIHARIRTGNGCDLCQEIRIKHISGAIVFLVCDDNVCGSQDVCKPTGLPNSFDSLSPQGAAGGDSLEACLEGRVPGHQRRIHRSSVTRRPIAGPY